MTDRYVARAIIVENDQVLVGKRARGMGKDEWALPGGKPDGDETMEEAVRREVQEELGVKFVPIELFRQEVNIVVDPGTIWHASYYSGRIEGKITLKEDEISEVALVDPENMRSYRFAFNHETIIADFFADQKEK